jgi:1-phosphofructokinase family hexose kinase
VEVEELIYDDVNRITEERSRPGGKGIDVSRVIKNLGGESVALGFAGGDTGMELEGELVNEGVVCDFTPISGPTRSNVIVLQKRKKLQTLLSTSAPEVGQLEIMALLKKLKELPKGSFVVISGSAPSGMDENFCAQVITALKEKEIKVVIDADENVLRHGVAARPYLMKPNIHEFGRLVEKNLTEVDEVIEYAKPYLDYVDYIVVSMGPRGAVGISRDEIFHMIPPKVKVRNSVGAGDSLVAGLIFALNGGGGFKEGLRLGVACGTASTLNLGVNGCSREDVEAIEKDVIVKKF